MFSVFPASSDPAMKLFGLLLMGSALWVLANEKADPVHSLNAQVAQRNAHDTNRTQQLFLTELADMFYVEKRLVKKLGEMSEQAMNPEVSSAFTKHKRETEEQVNRLQQVYMLMGHAAEEKKCAGLEGLLEEGDGMASKFLDGAMHDVVAITAARKVEHYEMAAYLALIDLAQRMGKKDVIPYLQENRQGEKESDAALEKLLDRVGPRVAQR